MKKTYHWITVILSLLVIGVMAYILIKEWNSFKAFPWHINWGYLLGVWFFHSLSVASTFWAWHLMIARIGLFQDVWFNLRYYYISHLARRLPTSIPYIGGRLVMYKRMGVSSAAVLNCSILETVLIGIGGIIFFLFLSPFYTNLSRNLTRILAVVGIGFVILFVLRPQIVIDFSNYLLMKLKKKPLETIPSRKDILIWIGIYIFPWLFGGLAFYLFPLALSNYKGLGIFDALQISTLSALVSLSYLVVPGGLALKEVTSTALLTAWIPVSAALVISIAFRLMQTSNEILWALGILLVPLRDLPDKNNESVSNPKELLTK